MTFIKMNIARNLTLFYNLNAVSTLELTEKLQIIKIDKIKLRKYLLKMCCDFLIDKYTD
jgi:hypothetical protein